MNSKFMHNIHVYWGQQKAGRRHCQYCCVWSEVVSSSSAPPLLLTAADAEDEENLRLNSRKIF